MYLTCLGFKGGVGKTTTAIHLAAALNEKAPTLLIDGDANRSATHWASHKKLPFPVVDERSGVRAARDFAHVVIDTAARPAPDDLRALANACDLLVLPTTAEAMALNALFDTAGALASLKPDLSKPGSANTAAEMHFAPYRILLTIVPPKPSRDGDEAYNALAAADLPVLKTTIRRGAAFQKASLTGQIVRDVDDMRAAACWEDYVRALDALLRSLPASPETTVSTTPITTKE